VTIFFTIVPSELTTRNRCSDRGVCAEGILSIGLTVFQRISMERGILAPPLWRRIAGLLAWTETARGVGDRRRGKGRSLEFLSSQFGRIVCPLWRTYVDY
jgi:hypothetical protein